MYGARVDNGQEICGDRLVTFAAYKAHGSMMESLMRLYLSRGLRLILFLTAALASSGCGLLFGSGPEPTPTVSADVYGDGSRRHGCCRRSFTDCDPTPCGHCRGPGYHHSRRFHHSGGKHNADHDTADHR